MTEVCFVGDPEVNLRYELLSRETARDALQTYDLGTPFHNTVGVDTVSLGAAVALVNDLNWYVVRFVDDVIVREPSITETEWLSRALATAIRDDERDPGETDRYLKVYGLEHGHGAERPSPAESPGAGADSDDETAPGDRSEAGGSSEEASPGGPPGQGPETGTAGPARSESGAPPRLVEPMYVTRTGDTIPDYDLRDVAETLVVRVTEDEFGA